MEWGFYVAGFVEGLFVAVLIWMVALTVRFRRQAPGRHGATRNGGSASPPAHRERPK